ncbi:MAG: shikimate dehydrogenase [Patescibacteria group bacterium]|nr:shikimate dehydrogenase [Patescibacteria group bacterium]
MFCGCVGEKNLKDCNLAIKKAREDGADLVELRIDYLSKKDECDKIIIDVNLPIIATNRGGNQKILIKAIKSGAKYIDMDISEIDFSVLNFAKKQKCKVIISCHNFQNTPRVNELFKIVKKARKKGADIIKIITTAKKEKDNQTILSLYEYCNIPLIAFAMGKIGQPTRMECLTHGALWTYCSVGKNKTATGQISLKQAKKIKLYGVIGNPISHSMSPAMHSANFQSLKINARYSAVFVKNLKNYMATIAARGISGINVTIPHKVEVMKYLDKIDILAEKIGAINTVKNYGGELVGYNTDGYGALKSLREKVKNIKNKRVVILGSGGAARAIYFTLKQEKADLIILARYKSEGENIGETLKLNNKNLKIELEKADILINCSPVGMNSDETLVPKEYLKKNLVIFDIVYTPIKTRLIKDAEAAGSKTVLGYKMLAYQGAESFNIWTERKADASAMADVVRNRLLPNITLVGFMGSGKTTVGKVLAEKLNRNFIDLDAEIEKRAKSSITEIFAKHGEARFRKMEKDALKSVLKNKTAVIACGGGVILKKENRELLKKFSTVIFLEAKAEIIAARLKNDKSRPLLDGSDKEKIKKIKEMIKKRIAFYQEVSDCEIDTNMRSPKKPVEKIVRFLIRLL